MKIAFVNRFFFTLGGAEVIMLNEMKILNELGHEISIFSINDERNIETESREYFIKKDSAEEKLDNRVELSLFEQLKYLRTILFNNDNIKKSLELFIKTEKPDIIHVHGYSRFTTPAVFEIAQKMNIPVVTTEHSSKHGCPISSPSCSDMHCLKGNPLYSLKNRCNENSLIKTLPHYLEFVINKSKYLNNIDGMIVPSLYMKNLLIEAGFDHQKIHFLRNFVDIDLFSPCFEHENYFLYYGRIARQKGLITLIKAFKELPGLRLKIVGDGPLKSHLSSYIKEQNLSNIELIDQKSGVELIKLIQKAKTVILPSEGRENAPLSVLEAFSCGKPVIGTNFGGTPEIIDENINGYLFSPNEIDQLREYVTRLAELNDESVAIMGKSARKKIEKYYTLKAHVEELIKIYNDVINDKR